MPRLPKPSAAYKRRPTGDAATIARKRFYRKAESYMKQAEASTGATAGRFRALAQLQLEDALKTYSQDYKRPYSKPIQQLADKLGVDLEEARRNLQAKTKEAAEKVRSNLIDLKGDSIASERSLRSREITVDEMREEEARAILNSPLGRRVIGSTVDIWREAATVYDENEEPKIDKTKILPALYKHYKVDNLADLLEAMEKQAGDEFYKDPDSEVMYETVKLTIAKHVITDNKVTL